MSFESFSIEYEKNVKNRNTIWPDTGYLIDHENIRIKFRNCEDIYDLRYFGSENIIQICDTVSGRLKNDIGMLHNNIGRFFRLNLIYFRFKPEVGQYESLI